MTYKTRWCPRMFRGTPFVGDKHWCVDCAVILAWRRLRYFVYGY